MRKWSWAFLEQSDALLQTFQHSGKKHHGVGGRGLLWPKKRCVITASPPRYPRSGVSQKGALGLRRPAVGFAFPGYAIPLGRGRRLPAVFHSSTAAAYSSPCHSLEDVILLIPRSPKSPGQGPSQPPGPCCCMTFFLLSLLGWGEERVAASHLVALTSVWSRLFAHANCCNFFMRCQNV